MAAKHFGTADLVEVWHSEAPAMALRCNYHLLGVHITLWLSRSVDAAEPCTSVGFRFLSAPPLVVSTRRMHVLFVVCGSSDSTLYFPFDSQTSCFWLNLSEIQYEQNVCVCV